MQLNVILSTPLAVSTGRGIDVSAAKEAPIPCLSGRFSSRLTHGVSFVESVRGLGVRTRDSCGSCRRPSRVHGVFVKAEQSGLDEKVQRRASEGAEDSGAGVDRSVRLQVDQLIPVEHPGTQDPGSSPESACSLEPNVEERSDEAYERLMRQSVSNVASDMAVESPSLVHDVAKNAAQELAPGLGQSVEDNIAGLEDRAEVASKRDAELLKTDGEGAGEYSEGEARQSEAMFGKQVELSKSDEDWEGGVRGGEHSDVHSWKNIGDSEGKLTRDEATEKILETVRDGIEVLRWAVEGIVSIGANSKEGFQVAKEIIDKRVKSLNIAADETKNVSTRVAEMAKQKYEEMQGSAAKFHEELHMNLDLKATEVDQPASETNPLAKLSRELQETVSKATKEDGRLARLGQGLHDSLSKANQAGKDLVSNKSEKSSAKREDPDFLVPVGEKGGFFQDLGPASGSSLKPGDTAAEASDILGSTDSEEQENTRAEASGDKGSKCDSEEVVYEGFFGDIPVRRPSATGGDESYSSGPEVEKIEDVEVVPQESLNEQSCAQSQFPSTRSSADASGEMKNDYEHEYGNEQLQQVRPGAREESDWVESTTGAAKEGDEAEAHPSSKNNDLEMGIGHEE